MLFKQILIGLNKLIQIKNIYLLKGRLILVLISLLNYYIKIIL